MARHITPQQKEFVRLHIVRYFKKNATQAYKDAGYKWKNDETARVCASKLLTSANIKKEIEKYQQEIEDLNSEDIVTLGEIAIHLSNIIRRNTNELPSHKDVIQAAKELIPLLNREKDSNSSVTKTLLRALEKNSKEVWKNEN